MSMIRLELSNRDYNTIAEALLESALDWEHAADELGRLHQFCVRTEDPAYETKLARLDREQCCHRRLARRRRAVLERLQKQKEAESCLWSVGGRWICGGGASWARMTGS